MLIRDRRFDLGECDGDDSAEGLGCSICCSTSGADAAGAESSRRLMKSEET